MSRTFALAAMAVVGGAVSVAAHDRDRLALADLEWREIVPGVVSFAAAYGDWEKEAHGKFVRIEPGASVPMHTHGKAYHAVLHSGELTNLLDTAETRVDLGPGDYWHMAGGRPHGHICASSEPCIVYVHSDGAWDLTLVE